MRRGAVGVRPWSGVTRAGRRHSVLEIACRACATPEPMARRGIASSARVATAQCRQPAGSTEESPASAWPQCDGLTTGVAHGWAHARPTGPITSIATASAAPSAPPSPRPLSLLRRIPTVTPFRIGHRSGRATVGDPDRRSGARPALCVASGPSSPDVDPRERAPLSSPYRARRRQRDRRLYPP